MHGVMKGRSYYTTLCFAVGLFAVASLMISPSLSAFGAPAGQASLKGAAANEKIPNQYIVVLKDNADDSPNEVANEARERGAEVLYVYQYALEGFAVRANEQALEHIKDNPNVDYVEQDQVVEIFAQNIPTGINRIDADVSISTASGDGSGSVDVDIAIIDTGIDLDHPDLNVYKQKSFVKSKRTADDDNGHGSHVAGTAAAKDDSSGVVGVSPGARLWAVKVLDRNGSGSMSAVIAGVDYVTQNAASIDVANMSLGCKCTSSSLNSAMSNSVAAGVTYAVAAGNNAEDAGSFSPANHPDVITVSAIADSDGKCGGLGSSTSYGADDTFATFSNYGSTIELAAPGVKIYSTYKGGSYATLSGTSMAAPHVAGAAGLYKASNPTASPSEVLAALTSSASISTTTCDATLNDGRGYFSGDKDSSTEPLLHAGTL
jgi:subtilisin